MCRNLLTRKCIVPRTSILDPHGVYLLKIPEPTFIAETKIEKDRDKEREKDKDREREKDKEREKKNEKYSDFFHPDDLAVRRIGGTNVGNIGSISNHNIHTNINSIGCSGIESGLIARENANSSFHYSSETPVLYLWKGK